MSTTTSTYPVYYQHFTQTPHFDFDLAGIISNKNNNTNNKDDFLYQQSPSPIHSPSASPPTSGNLSSPPKMLRKSQEDLTKDFELQILREKLNFAEQQIAERDQEIKQYLSVIATLKDLVSHHINSSYGAPSNNHNNHNHNNPSPAEYQQQQQLQQQQQQQQQASYNNDQPFKRNSTLVRSKSTEYYRVETANNESSSSSQEKVPLRSSTGGRSLRKSVSFLENVEVRTFEKSS